MMANKTNLKRPLRILYWNTGGVERDKLLLGVVMERESIDLALLGETKLKPNRNIKIRNYITYHNPGPNPPNGGTAILVKRSIQHQVIQLPSSPKSTGDCRKNPYPI